MTSKDGSKITYSEFIKWGSTYPEMISKGNIPDKYRKEHEEFCKRFLEARRKKEIPAGSGLDQFLRWEAVN